MGELRALRLCCGLRRAQDSAAGPAMGRRARDARGVQDPLEALATVAAGRSKSPQEQEGQHAQVTRKGKHWEIRTSTHHSAVAAAAAAVRTSSPWRKIGSSIEKKNR